MSDRIDVSDLVFRAQTGCQEAFNCLRDAYRPLIESCIKKRAVCGMNYQDLEELQQEALIGFYRAVCTYDSSYQGVEFGLYAKICVDNSLLSYLRVYNREQRGNTLPLEPDKDAYADIDLGEDFLGSLIERESEAELVHKIKNCLSDYENRIWWHYVSGTRVQDIAIIVGSDSKSVSNAIYRIRKKLRAIIGRSIDQGNNS